LSPAFQLFSIPLVKVLVIPVAALTRPPWTPALKASLDQPRPCSASQVMALMALEAVGGSPSVVMLGKGRIQGDLGSCLGKSSWGGAHELFPSHPLLPFHTAPSRLSALWCCSQAAAPPRFSQRSAGRIVLCSLCSCSLCVAGVWGTAREDCVRPSLPLSSATPTTGLPSEHLPASFLHLSLVSCTFPCYHALSKDKLLALKNLIGALFLVKTTDQEALVPLEVYVMY
jgi:hypothetical protein